MKTDDEIVAEWMGIKFEKDPCVKSKKKYWHYKELRLMSETLRFQTSWDWIMPVVERIESIGSCSFDIHKTQTLINVAFNGTSKCFYDLSPTWKLHRTFKVIVAYVKWHNQQKL